jgi:O-antigen/teichoic acid export membrane protein
MYRSQQDIEGMRRATSSVFFMQIGIGAVVMMTVVILSALLPVMIKNLSESDLSTARSVLFYLCASLAIQCAFGTFRGVITGCHRWDVSNIMMGISEAAAIAGMVSVLIVGGGLSAGAAIYLTAVLLTESARMIVAYRVCPELKIKKKYINFKNAKEMFLFGAKTFVNGIAQMVIVNSTCIMIGGILGPTSLAVFSRPMALIRNFQAFIDKFAFVITPTTGSLVGMGKIDDLRHLFVSSCRYGNAIAFPCAAFLIGYADIILKFWMGSRYAEGTILQVLALF